MEIIHEWVRESPESYVFGHTATLVSALRVCQLIAMRVDLEDKTERVFDITHSVGLLSSIGQINGLS